MTELQKEFEATGYTSWINADLYPDGKIYTQEYTEWLEKQVQELRKHDAVGQSEQLKAFLSTMIEEFDNGEVSWETRDSAESLLKSL